MTIRCSVCGGADTCPAGRYRVGGFRPVRDEEIIRAAAPLSGCAVTHKVGGKFWCVPLIDAHGWRLVRMGTSAARRFVAHFGLRPTWVGQCEYAIYVEDTR
ncbi:MAG: hypothetical protein KatS3mg038_2450 [Candidatus Kapaibacterium sp.]|nr:MAG: hypothetical protein KatS3mg038_2003 [Candidatus Kapabacteria bacterium]GIV51929.1 MAG: hypothetical protein KatS3mg038_2450 [Candidatus Kapabacteria bacterium]